MPLGSLLELVETLRKRIGGHRAALSSNEMLTRYALVDPLLCELGWDTADPAVVIPEDTSGLGRGRPDYVLQNNGQPAMVIEAKRLGSGLQNGARQAIDYAMDANRQARYFAITDGQHWEIYDTNRPASNMRAATFDIMAASPAEVCLKAMALWRAAVEYGVVMAAEKPIVGLEGIERHATEPVDLPLHEPEPTPQVRPAISEPTAPASQVNEIGDWIPISEFSPEKEHRVPTELRFPDGNSVQIDRWFMLLTETVRWLYDNQLLTEANPHVRSSRNFIVSDSPFNPDGRPFAWTKSIGPLHVEAHGHRLTLIRKTRTVIGRTGQDPSQFKVRLSS